MEEDVKVWESEIQRIRQEVKENLVTYNQQIGQLKDESRFVQEASSVLLEESVDVQPQSLELTFLQERINRLSRSVQDIRLSDPLETIGQFLVALRELK